MLQTGASFPDSLLLDTHHHTAHWGKQQPGQELDTFPGNLSFVGALERF